MVGRQRLSDEDGICQSCGAACLEHKSGLCRSCYRRLHGESRDLVGERLADKGEAYRKGRRPEEEPGVIEALAAAHPHRRLRRPPPPDGKPAPPCQKTAGCLMSAGHAGECRVRVRVEAALPGVQVAAPRPQAPAVVHVPAIDPEAARLASAARTLAEGRQVDGERLERERAEQRRPGPLPAGERVRGLTKRGGVWWIDMRFDGVRYQRSCRTGDLARATEIASRLRAELEAARQRKQLDEVARLAGKPADLQGGDAIIEQRGCAGQAVFLKGVPGNLSPEQQARANELLAAGVGQREVGRELGVSQATVSRFVRSTNRGLHGGWRAEEAHRKCDDHFRTCEACRTAGGFQAPAARLCLVGLALVRRWARFEEEAASLDAQRAANKQQRSTA